MNHGWLRLATGAVIAVLIACSKTTPTDPSPTPGGGGGGTPPTSSPDIALIGAGDIATCGQPGAPATTTVMQNLLERYPNAVAFTAGDNVYPDGSAQQFIECYDPTWGKFKARTRPTAGNHEYNLGNATPYFNYFGSQAGPSGLGYYAYSLGDWRIIALNSEIPAQNGSAQMAWLKDELSGSNRRDCTAAIWHRPLFTSGQNGPQADMKDFWRALYDANVDVIINGHDHLYERFAPQDPDGRADIIRGIRQFTVGTGGAAVYSFTSLAANSEMRFSNWGVIVLKLSAGSYSWEFAPAAGSTAIDSGIGSCH